MVDEAKVAEWLRVITLPRNGLTAVEVLPRHIRPVVYSMQRALEDAGWRWSKLTNRYVPPPKYTHTAPDRRKD